MAWYWPFKRKPTPTPARNGGTVQVEIAQSGPFEGATERAAALIEAEQRKAATPRLPVKGDRVRIGQGSSTWVVQFHVDLTDYVLVSLYDSLGRLQTRYVPRGRLTIITDFRDDAES